MKPSFNALRNDTAFGVYRRLAGPLLTLAVILLLLLLSKLDRPLSHGMAAILLTVTFSSFVSGLAGGLVSAALCVGFYVYYYGSAAFSAPHPHSFLPFFEFVPLTVATVFMVWFLRGWLLAREHLRVEQVQTEAALRRMERLVQGLNGIVWQADAATWRFSFVSRQAERMLGYPVEAWMNGGSDFFVGLVHEDDRERMVATYGAAAARGEDHDDEYRMVTASGDTVWVRDVVRVSKDALGRPETLFGLIVDVTERKQIEEARETAQAALRESETRVRSIVDNVTDGIITVDEVGTIVSFNPAAERIFGYPVEEAIGQNVKMLMPEPYLSEHETYLRHFLDKDEGRLTSQGREVAGKRKNGRIFPLELSLGTFQLGDKHFFTGVARDISERKRVEFEREQLLIERDSQREFLEKLVENASIGIAVVECPEFRIILANPSYRSMAGPAAGTVLGHTIDEVFPQLDAAGVKRVLYQAVASNETVSAREFPARSEGGAPVAWWDMENVPLRDADGAVDKVLILALDVTEQVRARRDVERLAAEAEANLAQLRTVINNMTEGLSITGADGKLLTMNPAALQLYGIESPESIEFSHTGFPKHFEKFDLAGQPVPLRQWPVERALRGETYSDFEVRVRAKATGRTWIASYGGTPVYNRDGDIVLAVVTMRDITASKEAEEALRQSEERFRRLAETSTVGLFMGDDHGGITYANPSLLSMLNYSQKELLSGRIQWQALTPPEYQAADANAAQELLQTGQCAPYEKEYIAKDGRRVPVLVGISVLERRMNAESLLAAFVMDLTPLKNAEAALRESEVRYRGIFDHAALGIAQASPKGRLLEVNQRLCDLLGYAREALLTRSLMDLVPAGTTALTKETLAALAARKTARSAQETEFVRIDGTHIHVNFTASLVRDGRNRASHFVITVEDIGRRRQAEEALAREHAAVEMERRRLRATLDIIPVGVFIADADGHLRETNPACRVIWGGQTPLVGTAEFGTYRASRTADGTEMDSKTWALARALRGEPTVQGEELDIECFDGTGKTILNYAVPIRDTQGRIVGGVAVNVDITDRRRAEEELRRLNETLEERVIERTAIAEQRAVQLRALAAELTQAEQRERRRLAQTLHDHLQQLLVAAKFGVGMLRQRADDEDASNGLSHVEDLLNQALDASRSLTVELSPPILYDAGLATALEWLSRQMAQNHHLTVEVSADSVVDPDDEDVSVFLFQAVRELLFNIVKHAGVNRAWVNMESAEGDQIRITVTDHGVGYRPPKQEGTETSGGFGLFSIRERLALLGGSLGIRGGADAGTQITLTVPRHAVKEPERLPVFIPAPQTPQQDISATHEGKLIRVLLADDHALLRAGLSRLLQQEADLEVVGEAHDGLAAVELASALKPHVVLMDVTMPRMNGIEATRRIVGLLPETRVIGLSMHEEADMAEAMRAAGAWDYLPKDCPAKALIAAIHAAAMAPRPS